MLARLVRIRRQQLHGLRSMSVSARSPVPRRSIAKYIIIGATAGTVGGGLLIGAGYIWYINSGIKRAVDTVKPALVFLGDTKSELGKKAPSHVLSHLRQACKAYLAYIPLSGFVVDRGFDAVDGIVDAHADEANAIISEAHDEVLQVLQRDGNAHKTGTPVEILAILQRLLGRLQALGAKAGQPLADALELEKRGEQLTTGAAAVLEVAKAKGADASHALAEALEKAKEHMPEAQEQVASTANKVAQKVKDIFQHSEK